MDDFPQSVPAQPQPHQPVREGADVASYTTGQVPRPNGGAIIGG